MKLKAIIIDDEQQARRLLSNIIKTHVPQIELLDECEDLPFGVKSIRKLKPDLVFLDIEMPRHSGLDIVDFFTEEEMTFGIIFTTAYDQYAIKAFKLNAIDYLLKPIDVDDLVLSVQRFEKRNTLKAQLQEVNQVIETGLPKRIAVPQGHSLAFIELKEIMYLKAVNSYTEVFLISGKKQLISRTLKNFEETLKDNTDFIRCHKSFIVNMNAVKQLNKSDGGSLEMMDGAEIPINAEAMNEVIQGLRIVCR